MEKIFKLNILTIYILRIAASQFRRKAPLSLREGVGLFFVWFEGWLSVGQVAMGDAQQSESGTNYRIDNHI
jgi:hypothetical protein